MGQENSTQQSVQLLGYILVARGAEMGQRQRQRYRK